MKYILIFSICLSVVGFMHASSTFNPVPGTPVWDLVSDVGIMTSAIEGTQIRIQQSALIAGGYTISAPGRYALVEDITVSDTILVATSNVYLDLNGFTVNGSNNATDIVRVMTGVSNVMIINGSLIGGGVGVTGHVTIADNVMVTGATVVSKSIREPGVYSSGVGGLVTNREWRKHSARVHRLDQLAQRIKFLESALEKLTERE